MERGYSGEARGAALTSERSSKGLRVLIVDQHNSFDNILATNVACWGYEVVTVPSMMALWKSEVEGDVLLFDLDEAMRLSTLLIGKGKYLSEPQVYLSVNDDKAWHCEGPHARLMIVLSSFSVSRATLEQMGAVAFLHKPFEMGRLQRYLQVLQRLLYPEAKDGSVRMQFPLGLPLNYSEEEKPKQKMRILVVDDAVEVAQAVRHCLADEPSYEVAVAYDGLEALEQYSSWQPHCIVTDLIMPWMNGYQVMRCLAAGSIASMPAFVVMSALTQFEIPVNRPYLKDQVVVYIDKPFHVEHLLCAVEQALASHGRITV